jgi:hypothetical protein
MTKTVGLNPKVPAQAVATIVVFCLLKLGLEVDADVSAAIGTLIGFLAGVVAPPAPTVVAGLEDTGRD